MKKIIAIVLLLAVMLTGCANGGKPDDASPDIQSPIEGQPVPQSPDPTGAVSSDNKSTPMGLSVGGTQLLAADGTPIQLRGLSSHGLSWFPEYVNTDVLTQLKQEWGCNVFRLAMYTAEYNGYCIGDEANRTALKARIDEAVKAAEALEMYIIIDWHTLSDNNPLTHKAESATFFKEMAKKYADKPHVIYEICNEPNGATTWDDIRAYADTIIPVIRAHTNAVVLVGTPTWSQDIHLAAAKPLEGYQNIMYTLHFYAATHKESLRERMVSAIEGGLPVFVSEFGICDASGNGAIDEKEANLWLEAMNKHVVSYVMWNLSNKNESSAILSPSCTKTSGFTQSDLSPAGVWFTQTALKAEAPSHNDSPSPADPPQGGNDETGLTYELTLESSWERQGKKYHKYILSIHNSSDSDLAAWGAALEFDKPFAIDNSWNGIYTADNSTLSITPESYNAKLPAGESIHGIGFILESDGTLSLTEGSIA